MMSVVLLIAGSMIVSSPSHAVVEQSTSDESTNTAPPSCFNSNESAMLQNFGPIFGFDFINGVLLLSNWIADKIQNEEAKEDNVRAVVNEVQYCFPQYNVVVAQPSGDSQSGRVRERSIEHMSGVALITSAYISDTLYRIYVFKSGTFVQQGDLGWKNWGYSGYFTKSADGRTVTFTDPPDPVRKPGWQPGDGGCEVQGQSLPDRNRYYNTFSVFDGDATGETTRMLVNDFRRCFPDYDVVVMTKEQASHWVTPPASYVYRGTYNLNEDGKSDPTGATGGPGLSGRGHYDVYVFDGEATFQDDGDGGGINWAFYGKFTTSGTGGKTVSFDTPPPADLHAQPKEPRAETDFDGESPINSSNGGEAYPGCPLFHGTPPSDREALMKSIVADYQKCYPDTNILATRSLDYLNFTGLGRMRHIATVGTTPGVTYGIYVFALDEGEVVNKGDGGWINWGFSGTYDQDGLDVTFHPHGGPPPPPPSGKPRIRLEPLGASITQGYHSSDGNGYRAILHDRLSSMASSVDFVGSKRDGSMADGDDEGHSGYRIDQVADVAQCSIPSYLPNIVTLLVGTNDIQQQHDLGSAPQRIGGLLDQIEGEDPGVTILVTAIPPNTDTTKPELDAQTTTYNHDVAALIKSRNKHGEEFIDPHLTAADVGPDHIHPNDGGYRKIADALYQGVLDANAAGWIHDPAPQPEGATCESTGGDDTSHSQDGWVDRGQIAVDHGSQNTYWWTEITGDKRTDRVMVDPKGNVTAWTNHAVDTTTHKIVWQNQRTLFTNPTGYVGNQERFADIDGDGIDDCLFVTTHGGIDAWTASGKTPCKTAHHAIGLNSGSNPSSSKIRFADLNGDGWDDYLVIYNFGETRVWLNGGPKYHGWRWTPMAHDIVPSGASQVMSSWADINGDHLADLLKVHPDGSMEVSLNEGSTDFARGDITFNKLGTKFNAVPHVPGADIRFADVDGDGKVDYLRQGPSGAVHEWLNRVLDLPTYPGIVDDHWYAQGQVAVDHSASDKFIWADWNGDGPADRLVINPAGDISVWLNGGLQTRGNGLILNPAGTPFTNPTGYLSNQLRMANLDGDHPADCVFVDSNGGMQPFTHSTTHGTCGTKQDHIHVDSGAIDPSKLIRFADIDGDGKDDYVIIEPDGGLHWWRNTTTTTGANTGTTAAKWTRGTNIASPEDAGASQVRLADITGDGKADYLTVAQTGAVTSWQDTTPTGTTNASFTPLGSSMATYPHGIAGTNVGHDIQFADLNGDGKADYLRIGPKGATRAWIRN